jgi:hypothetical protein
MSIADQDLKFNGNSLAAIALPICNPISHI